MNKNRLKKKLKQFLVVFLGCLFSSYSFSQNINDDIQKIYDQTKLYGYFSQNYGNNPASILNYATSYGFAKIFTEEEILNAFINEESLTHVHDLETNPYYCENIYFQYKDGKILNLHPYRGDNAFQPQWPYMQTFAIYKILLPIKAYLIIDVMEINMLKTEMYLGINHDSDYAGSKENMIHIFRYSNDGLNLPSDKESGMDNMKINLPAGEYYLFISCAPSGIRGTYLRGNIGMRFQVLDTVEDESTNNGNLIAYSYDAAGNRIERKTIKLTKSTEAIRAQASVFIDELSKRTVKIYPNPTKGQLKVEIFELDNSDKGTISIYNRQGRLITKKNISVSTLDFDISTQPDGLYVMHIEINGQVSTWKILKQ